MPWEESGSKREAESPAASQPSPNTGSSPRDEAERTTTSPQNLLCSTSTPTLGMAARFRRHSSATLSLLRRARSASVKQATMRRPSRKPAVYHQPSAKASTIVRRSPLLHSKNPPSSIRQSPATNQPP